MKTKRLHTLYIILTILSFHFTNAQSLSAYEKMLTNDSFQEWVRIETEVHLGNECTTGLKLKFVKQNKEVIRKECVKNKWQSEASNWIIKQEGTQWLLIFGPYTFEIDFLSNPYIEHPDRTNIEMRLRQTIIDGEVSSNRVSPDKKKEVIDLFFNKN